MILAEIDWLSISINLLLIVFVVNCLLMSMVILMQRPKQEGLGAAFGSGMTDQVFGARTTSVLQKGTVYLATLFFILTLTLAILFAKQNKNVNTLVTEETAPEEIEEVVETAPAPSLEEELAQAGGEDAPAVTEETPEVVTPEPAIEEAPAAPEMNEAPVVPETEIPAEEAPAPEATEEATAPEPIEPPAEERP